MINERREGEEDLSDGNGEFVCECGDPTCATELRVSIGDYEKVRSDPRRFIIASGHGVEGVESIVERHGEYDIVEKNGTAGRVAEEEDPRDS
jgi:hypothetical protein